MKNVMVCIGQEGHYGCGVVDDLHKTGDRCASCGGLILDRQYLTLAVTKAEELEDFFANSDRGPSRALLAVPSKFDVCVLDATEEVFDYLDESGMNGCDVFTRAYDFLRNRGPVLYGLVIWEGEVGHYMNEFRDTSYDTYRDPTEEEWKMVMNGAPLFS